MFALKDKRSISTAKKAHQREPRDNRQANSTHDKELHLTTKMAKFILQKLYHRKQETKRVFLDD